MKRFALVAILGFGILLLLGCGQRQASITGLVTDSESGKPLEDVTITVGEDIAKTGSDGHYLLDEIPSGHHTLTARMEGYKPYDRQIDTQENQDVTLDIILSPLEKPSPPPIAGEGRGPHRAIERASSDISPDEGGDIVITEAESVYSNGFTLSIPPGALEEETTITVGDVTDDFPPIPNGFRPVGLPISLEPHGLAFQIPVTVKIPYSDEMLAWAGTTSPEKLLLKAYDLSTNEWTDVPIVQVDTQDKVIVAEIDHFSLFSLFSWWNRKETENPATNAEILTYINDSWGVVATVDDLSQKNPNTGIPFKDEIGGILTVITMGEQIQNAEYRKATITGGEWLAWQALKAAGYGWLRPSALLVEATYKGGEWFVKKVDEGAFNAQICAYLYYRREGYSVKEIKHSFITDDGWVLTAMGTGCPPGYPRLTGRFKPEDVFRIGRLVWDAKQSGSYKQRDTESIRDAFIHAIRPAVPNNQPPQVRITSPSEEAIFMVGEIVNLEGTAIDPEDGPLTGSSLRWGVETDGSSTFVGEGEALSLSDLSEGTHRIFLTAKDSQGQTAEDSVEITVQALVNVPPKVTITAPSDASVFQEGESIQFVGSAIDPEDGLLAEHSLVWVSGIDGLLGFGQTLTRNNLSPGTHAITLSATDSHSTFSSKTVTILIKAGTPNELPIADAGPDQVIPVGKKCALDGSGSYDPDGHIATYSWKIGDGKQVSGKTISHTYTKEGTYTIVLTVVDDRGDTSTDEVTVKVRSNTVQEKWKYSAHNVTLESAAEGWQKVLVQFVVENTSDTLLEVPDDLGKVHATWNGYEYEGVVDPPNCKWVAPGYRFLTTGSVTVPASASKVSLYLIRSTGASELISLKGPWEPLPQIPTSRTDQLLVGDSFNIEDKLQITLDKLHMGSTTDPYEMSLKVVIHNQTGYAKQGSLSCQIMENSRAWKEPLLLPTTPPMRSTETSLPIDSFAQYERLNLGDAYEGDHSYHVLLINQSTGKYWIYRLLAHVTVESQYKWRFALPQGKAPSALASTPAGIYLGFSDGTLTLIDPETGTQQEALQLEGSVVEIAHEKEHVYYLTKAGRKWNAVWHKYEFDENTRVLSDISTSPAKVQGGWIESAHIVPANNGLVYFIQEIWKPCTLEFHPKCTDITLRIDKERVPGLRNVGSATYSERSKFGETTKAEYVVAAGDILYIMSRDNVAAPGTLWAIRWPSFEPLWDARYNFPPLPIAFENGTLYAGNRRKLCAYDPMSGVVRWEYDPPTEAGCPTDILDIHISPSAIYLRLSGGYVYSARTTDTGASTWFPSVAKSGTTILGVGDGVVYVKKDNALFAIRTAPGITENRLSR